MTERESGDGPRELDGLSVDRAVDTVVDDEETAGEVRETLAIVARDGTISRRAVDDAVANASMVVTTAETRVELAAERLDDVRETAAPVSDLELVSARIDDYEARLDVIDDRADDLGSAVQEVLAMKAEGDLYEIAQRIRRVTNAATEVQRSADDFQLELDSFREWLTDADRRAEELADDLDALAESVAELDEVAETLAAEGGGPETEAARRWAGATVRHRVASLMIADLRAELAALRTWADRESRSPP
jgi:chromosome segregation ATPase